MYHNFRVAAWVALLLPLASGCSSVPRWDWWRSAQNGPPPGVMAAANNAPKYPALPSSKSTPENMTASNNTGPATGGTSNPFPPGTAAPANNFPATGNPAGSMAATNQSGGYPSTAATGANNYPATGGNYSPQTTPYNPGAYNASTGAPPAARMASNTNAYGAPNNSNAGAADAYPGTNTPSYPNTSTGYTNSATPGGAAGYQAGSPYDASVGDRYGATNGTNPGAAPASTAPANGGYGAPGATGYGAPGATQPNSYGNPGPPAGNSNPPAQNYGNPNYGGSNGYQGSDSAPTTGGANYASTPGASSVGDRYANPSMSPNNGPIATTADRRGAALPANAALTGDGALTGNSALPGGGTHYDSAVTPASGGSYLPAGTKRLEDEMPSTPSSTPANGSSIPSGNSYGRPGSMG